MSKQYRCWLRSSPGMWARYDGYVDVFAEDESELKWLAVKKLARTSFPDRPNLDSWILERTTERE